VNVFKRKITAKDVKAKALEFGADLVGIADGEKVGARSVTEHDCGRAIVLAMRLA